MDKHIDSIEYVSSTLTITSACSLYMRRANAILSSALVFVVFAVTLSAPALGQRLQSATSYSVGKTLSGVAVGDFNRDGHPDLLLIDNPNDGSTNTVHVLAGNGDGTFQQPSLDSVATGALSAVVSGDFNGDGILDIAVTDSVNKTVAVLLGNGSGSFISQTPMPVGVTPMALAAADLDGDGKADLVVANFGSTTLTVFLGNGDGTFTPAGSVPAASPAFGFRPVGIVAGDFDNDGKLDLAVALTSNAMSMLKGNGNGTFQAAVTNIIFNFPNPSTIAATDFDSDGNLDLIITAGPLLLLRGKGNLQFQPPVAFNPEVGSGAALVADMNGDAHPDIVAAGFNGVSVLIGSKTDQIISTHNYSGPFFPGHLAVGDFNGDGRLDVVVITSFPDFLNLNNVQTMLGNGDGTLRGAFSYNFARPGESGSPIKIISGDFNNDGLPDIAISNAFSRIKILANSDNFNLSPVVPDNPVPDFGLDMIAADFNRDGNQDIIAIGFSSIFVLLGNGDGTFQAPLSQSIPFGFRSLVVGDFNNDGKLDVAFTGADQTLNTIGFLLGNGDGTLQPLEPQNILTTGELATAIATGDFNGDGNVDLAVANGGNGVTNSSVTILLGNGHAQFTPMAQQPTVGVFPQGMISAVDLNHDGILDLVVGNTGNGGPGSISVLLGNGDGTFQSTVSLPLENSALTITVNDFSGDGFADIAVMERGSIIDLFTNNGNGLFPERPARYSAGSGAVLLAAADLDSGGVSDLITAANTLIVLPNTGGTRISLTSSFNPSRLHQPVRLSATVTSTLSGYPVPTGTLQFLDSTVNLGSSLLSDGQAEILTSDFTPGTNFIVANYSGDNNYVPHISPGLPQVVLAPGPPMR
jgi:Bacterial Ig-like domain (group 3)/FG-GAP-like repeat/FG-GAP repeat